MHMRIPKISFRLMAGVLLLVLAAYGIGRYHARRTTPQAASDPVEVPSAAAAQIYTCSMHPQVRTPDPDEKCPICAMDLIPVPSDGENLDEDTGTPQLRISQRAAALMQLRTWPAERRDIARSMSLFGTIQRDENRVYKIVARPGRRSKRETPSPHYTARMPSPPCANGVSPNRPVQPGWPCARQPQHA